MSEGKKPDGAELPIEFAKTQPSAANPLLAKIQAEEKAAVERQLAAARAAAARPPVPTTQGPGVAAPRPELQRLRQPLVSRPLGPPVPTPVSTRSPDVITDPLPRGAVPPAVSQSTVVQRAPAPPPKTDPMQTPDVLAAISTPRPPISKSVPAQAMKVPPPAWVVPAGGVPPPTAPRPPAAPSAPSPWTLLEPGESIKRPVVSAPPVAMPRIPSNERTEIKRPTVTSPPVAIQPPTDERTEIARPAPPARVAPGVAMPAAAMKTQPGPVAAPQPVEKTEIRAAPARPDRVPNATPSGAVGRPAAPVSSQIGMPRPAADPRAAPTAQLDPLASGPTQISAKTGNTGANVALRPAQRGTPDPWATAQSGLARAEEDPWLPRPSQIDLTPAAPRIAPLDIDISESRPSAPGHTAIAPLLASEFDFTPAAPRPLIPSQAGVTPIEPRPIPEDATPYAPRPAMAETPPAQWAAPAVTAPNRPVPVVPPSFMDLPQIGARELTTQPGIAGPYTAQQPLQLTESPAATAIEDAPADQVLATPASLWRRTFASLFDFSLLGGVIGGLLFLAVGLVAGGKPMPNNLHGIDAFFFRLHPIAIPALGLTVLLAVLYTAMGAFLLRGRTFGRLLFGIRLVDSTGKSPGAVRSLVRAFFAIVSFVFFLAGFWLGLFDRKGQTLHDKLTRTFVVRPV